MRVVELEMPLVVKLEQGWAVRMLLLQVDVVNLGLLGRVAAVLTHVNLAKGGKVNIKSGSLHSNSHLRSSLLVIVTMVDSMYF